MKNLVVVHFFSLLVFTLGASLSCPRPEDLSRNCSCKPMGIGLHVLCQNFDDASYLVKTIEVLRQHPVQNILLHGLNLKQVLPDDLFKDTGITRLRIEESRLMFSKSAFEGLDGSLKEIGLKKTSIKCSEGFSLANLSQLTELNVKEISLPKVSNKLLNGKIPNVKILVVDENGILELENEAFAQLKHLETISAADNKIRNILRSMLPVPALALTKIDFSGNEISQLPEDFFTQMPVLSKVVLSGNDLTTLSESTWKPVWTQLDSVWVWENKLVCDNDLDWVKKKPKPRELKGLCVAPSEFIGKAITEVYRSQQSIFSIIHSSKSSIYS